MAYLQSKAARELHPEDPQMSTRKARKQSQAADMASHHGDILENESEARFAKAKAQVTDISRSIAISMSSLDIKFRPTEERWFSTSGDSALMKNMKTKKSKIKKCQSRAIHLPSLCSR